MLDHEVDIIGLFNKYHVAKDSAQMGDMIALAKLRRSFLTRTRINTVVLREMMFQLIRHAKGEYHLSLLHFVGMDDKPMSHKEVAAMNREIRNAFVDAFGTQAARAEEALDRLLPLNSEHEFFETLSAMYAMIVARYGLQKVKEQAPPPN